MRMRIETVSNVKVRPVSRSDREEWTEHWRAYQKFYGVELPAIVTDATWNRLHDDAEPVFGLVAESEGKLLGITHYLFHRSTWLETETCYLQDLFVDPIARGQGVGRSLIKAVYSHADARSSGRVYWLTHETNTTARRLYDSVAGNSGFIVYKRTLQTSHDD